MSQEIESPIVHAAEQLWQASKSRIPCPPIREIIGVVDLQAAYEVQNIITQKKIEEGAIPVGKKIGLTSEAVQGQLGVDQPDFGSLFQHMEIEDGGSILSEELMQAKVEAEFVFILKGDVPDKINDPAELLGAIDHVRIGLEVVGSRIKDWDIKITDTIADNASASHFVLGSESYDPQDIDMVGTKVRVYKNGEVVSEGIGEACMGSPMNACKWLANTMADLGNPLKKGEIILTGALGPLVAIEKGDEIRAIFEGLGEVAFRVA